ncbi:MAG: transpeptidase family protein, partial [Bacteroidetes bacterium]|nr:transpeptidase family protein [Fibrella sp.]
LYVQFFQQYRGKYWNQRTEGFQIRQDTLRAMRGNIFASDGSLLATSLPTYEVGIDPRIAKDEYFAKYSDTLGVVMARIFRDKSARDYSDLVRSARKSGRKYVLMNHRRITFQERQQLLTCPFFRSDKKIPARGGALRAYYERYQPFAQMAKRTIGNLDPKTNKGLIGLEASFQSQLAGKDGVGLVEVLAGGVRKPVDDNQGMKPEPGLDLYTTLDVNFQDMAETALKTALTSYNADKGCVLVMDVATGEIRAMANLSRLKDGNYYETFSHALAGRTDPGSTFKLASMMALLEEKAVSPGQMIPTGGGSIRYRNVTIQDAKRGGYGIITAQEVFEKSSNVGIHLMMKDYFYTRPDLYCQYLRKFHLTEKTGIHMKGEVNPVIYNPDSKAWSKTSLAFMAHGYEMQITPLQMLTFYNAVANDGRWVRPMLVKQVKLANEVIEETLPYTAPDPIASPGVIRQVKRMLEGVVERGTAKHIASPHYKIAGKTGTAQKIVNGLYQEGRYYTSFIGYFPADKPKYSCLVMVDSPHGSNINLLMAGSVSAPVFKEVADRIVAYDIRMHAPLRTHQRVASSPADLKAGYADDLHIISTELKLDSQPSAEGYVRRLDSHRWQSQLNRPDQVPDVRGLPLRDALPLLENRGFRVLLAGAGKVTDQSILPGTALAGTRKQITLTLQ